MATHVRLGTSFCIIEETALFLNVPEDRYFKLPRRANDAFVAWRSGAWLSVEDRTVLDAAGVLIPQCPRPVESAAIVMPNRQSVDVSRGDFQLGEIARAVWVQGRIERRLQSGGLEKVLQEVVKARSASCSRHARCDRGAAAVVRAFEHARVLRSPANKCLPRSLAVALCLARHGVHADVVLGVKLGPFAAHCWTQAHGEVLNDTVEEIARYAPILVV